MEHILWGKRYELGVEEIDLQHHYFASLINRLMDELDGSDDAYQARLIQELDAYAKFHFISEENLMDKAKYPGRFEHGRLHLALIDELNVWQMKFAQGQASARDITEFLRDWFVKHTLTEDSHFAAFVLGKAKP